MRWNIRYRLHRRVIEIRDARLVLRPYAKTEVAGLAADAAKSSGLAPGQSRCGRGSGAPGRTTKPFLFPEAAPEPPMPGQDMHRRPVIPTPRPDQPRQQGTGWTCAIGDTDSWALARI